MTLSIPDIKPLINVTPDDRDTIRRMLESSSFPIPEAKKKEDYVEGFPIHETSWEDLVLYKKQYPDTVDKIGKNYPRKGDLAGQKYPLPEELNDLCPDGIQIKDNGCPDFTPHAVVSIEIEGLRGDRTDDQKANALAGFENTPKDMTWHHVEDGKTMQLVPEYLHDQVRHTGGRAKIKESNKE